MWGFCSVRKNIDIFPALIKLAPPGSLGEITDLNVTGPAPSGTRKLDRARAVIIDDTLLIAVDTPTGPNLVFKEKIVEQHHEKKLSRVRSVSGKIIAIGKDVNCGCGSRLRGWNPYGAFIPSSQDPS